MNLLKLFLMLVLSWALASPVSAGGMGTYVFVPHGSNVMIAGDSSGSVTLTPHSQTYGRIQAHIRNLSSAQRITRAADDPSGLAVAEKMNAHLRQLKREVMNAHDYRNFLNYKEAVIAENIDHIQRLRELAMRAAGGIFSTSDRYLLQAEVEQLLRQIDMNAKNSSFNKKTVVPGLTVNALGLNGFSVVESPASKIGRLDEVQRSLIDLRTRSGLQSSALQLQIDGKQYYMLNLQDSESTIRDLDIAEALTDFSKDVVLYQTQTGLILHTK